MSAGIIIKTAKAHMPGQFIVNCDVKSINPTVNVFESVLLAKFETIANSFQDIRKAKIPIICICNDRQSQKVQSLANHSLDLRLRRPTKGQISARMLSIGSEEQMNIECDSLAKECFNNNQQSPV